MTENNWAEGSGSVWEVVGDPRIVPGAEVLVGEREPAYHRAHHGKRMMVTQETNRSRTGLRLSDSVVVFFKPRDLVCLKTTEGALTEEGALLAKWADLGPSQLKCGLWSDFDATRPVIAWAIRAGILVAAAERGGYVLDMRRFDMAMGREPESENADEPLVDGNMESADAPAWKAAKQHDEPCQVFDWALTPDEVQRVYQNTLAGKFSCKKCLAPIQEQGLCPACAAPTYYPSEEGMVIGTTSEKPRECPSCHKPLEPARDKYDVYGLCSDCGFASSGGEISLRSLGIDPEKIEDRSGEAALNALRRFVTGPCGRPR
jgi:hypothetical protein